MRIYDMFEKKIDRPITGVIKVGQNSDEDKWQELSEYVVTRELVRHFRDFFGNYARSIYNPTDEMGVWISGFFGSGKSHFLKILSYVLDNTEVHHTAEDNTEETKSAIDFFKEKEMLKANPMILGDMEKAARTPTKAILFNVDSKSAASAKSNSNAIVMVFNRVFNEKLGYDGANPALADLERTLDEEGNYQKFKDTYQQITGKTWLEDRSKFRVKRDKVVDTLVAIGRMSEQAARDWTVAATRDSYEIAIEDFAERVHQYIEKTGERVVFLVDEIGQFISTDSRLMLNLQTMTEELGTRCRGKAWIIVTAQEDMDSMMENMDSAAGKRNDFSKIMGRFKTRLSLTSVNADEVIRERILKKNQGGKDTLIALYESGTNETKIQNAAIFKGNGYEMAKIHNAEEFAADYPFLPYQFHLLADVLNDIRLNSASGRHLSEGERSMLGAFQEAAKEVMNEQEGVLVPFYRFYDDLVKFLDHTHASVIQRAEESERINPLHEKDCLAVNVLKTLFLLKYRNGIPATVDNIMNLMVTNINEDKTILRQKVEDALQLLTRSLLVAQVQDTYEFLTDEEQDINRAIRERNIQQVDIIKALARTTFDSIYPNARYRVPKFNGRYTFGYNQFVDNIPAKTSQNYPIAMRIITPRFTGTGSVIGTDDTSMTILSGNDKGVVLRLPNDNAVYYREMQNAMQIEDYIRNVADPQKGRSTVIRTVKMQEAGKSKTAALDAMKEAIGNAEIFINGQRVTDIHTHNAADRMSEALGRLVGNIYYKLEYIDHPEDDIDIRKLFKNDGQVSLDLGQTVEPNHLALGEVFDYIKATTGSHTQISMKGILDSFAREPYGYTDTDTKWLVAKLFRDSQISAAVDKEPITIYNRTPEDLGNYFTSRRFDEKILFRAKIAIDPKKLKAAKDVMKDLFHHTETSQDTDKVMESFRHEAADALQEVNGMLRTQRQEPQFSGKETLEETVRELGTVATLNEENAFYNWAYTEKDTLLDLAEDLAPVRTFYNSNTQQKIFRDDGLRALHFYENSKEHITDQRIRAVVDQIAGIVKSKAPFDRIKDLPDLYSKFWKIYGEILDEKLKPVQEAIEADKQSVLGALNGQTFEKEYSPRVVRDFNGLSERAKEESDISDMLGYKDKADSLLKTYMEKITELLRRTPVAPVTPPKPGSTPGSNSGQGGEAVLPEPSPKPRKVKYVELGDMVSHIQKINDTTALDAYLGKIRQAVADELDGNTDVYVHF